MNLSLPVYRNHFHPAWLLLLIAPVLGGVVDGYSDFSELGLASVLVRLLLAAMVVVPLGSVRWKTLGGTFQRLSKESRLHLPGCLLAFLAPGVGILVPDGGAMVFALDGFAIGCILMAASAFGHEFEQRTLGGLLSQPISRSRIFFEKLIVPGYLIALASANLVVLLDWRARAVHIGGEFAIPMNLLIMAVSSAPLFTLLSRGTLPGVVFAFAAPPILWLVESVVVRWLEVKLPDDWGFQGRLNGLVVSFGVPIYSVGSILAGWFLFAGLQLDKEGAGGKGSVGVHPMGAPLDKLLATVLPKSDWKSQLIRKEARLHVIPLLLAGIMIGLWVLVLVLQWMFPESPEWAWLVNGSGIVTFTGMLSALAIIGAGAAVVAEERELGTLEWQLTQPISLWRQWVIKVLVAALAAIFVGVVLPALLIPTCIGKERMVDLFGSLRSLEWAGYAWGGCLLFVVSVYASSLCRSTVSAAMTAVGIVALAVGMIALGVAVPTPTYLLYDADFGQILKGWFFVLFALSVSPIVLELLAWLSLGLVVLFVGMLWVAGLNFRAAPKSIRASIHQVGAVAAGCFVWTYFLMSVLEPIIIRHWGTITR